MNSQHQNSSISLPDKSRHKAFNNTPVFIFIRGRQCGFCTLGDTKLSTCIRNRSSISVKLSNNPCRQPTKNHQGQTCACNMGHSVKKSQHK